MSKPRKKRRPPKRVLALLDLEQSKAAGGSLPCRTCAVNLDSPLLLLAGY